MKRLLFALALILITAPSAQAGAKFNVFTDAIDYTTTGTAVAGDVTAVGDCTSNACFTGSSGTKITGDTSSNLEIETANTFNIDTGADGDNFTILHNGNVGIGTTAPSSRVHIADGDSNYGKSSTVSLELGDASGGTKAGTLKLNGTVSSSYGLIQETNNNLHIDAVSSSIFNYLYLNYFDGAGIYFGNGASAANGIWTSAGNLGIATTAPTAKLHVIQTGAADAFRVDDQASDTTPFVVDQAGNVGIGTSAPIEELHVNGDIIIPHTGKLKFRNNEDTSSIQAVGFDSGENMYVGGSAISQTYFETGGGIGLTVGSAQNIGIGGDTSPDSHLEVSAGGTTGGAIFQLSSDDGNDGDLLTALENGNVGIGTTAPSTLLHVQGGNIQVEDGNTAGAEISLGANRARFHYSGTDAILSAGTGKGIILATNSGATLGATPTGGKVFILSGGNVGIGTSAPSTQFHTTGGVRFANLTSCDTIDTDSNGVLSCGTDDGGAGSSLFTDGGDVTYLTSTTDDLALGGTDDNATFHFDVGTGVFTATSITTTGSGQSSASDLTVSGTMTVPASTGIVVDSNGEVAVDTSDGQLVYYSTSKRVINPKQTFCINKFDLVAADDDYPIMSFLDAATVTDVLCLYSGTGSTVASISLEDDDGNAMTHTAPTCQPHGTPAVPQSITAGGAIAQGELVRFDVDNTPDPTTDDYTICIGYTFDAQ